MAAFDDSTDPDLGAACNRLAAWVEPLPAGVVVDSASGLTEADLGLILRHLYAMRRGPAAAIKTADDTGAHDARPSVPITSRSR